MHVIVPGESVIIVPSVTYYCTLTLDGLGKYHACTFPNHQDLGCSLEHIPKPPMHPNVCVY